MKYSFPNDFLWGAATSSLQVEGFPNADGAGKTSWQQFSEHPGAILNDDRLDLSSDHFHRYREDFQILSDLGVRAYRFSINWARIFPEGRGSVNQKGVDFYSRLIDELLKRGIRPFATCFHWETPQALEERGGWRSKDTARALGDYAGFLGKTFGNRVKDFFTINEFPCFTTYCYGPEPTMAPREFCSSKEQRQAMHNAALGHGLAVQALRANAPKDVRIGIAQNTECYVPLYESQEHIDAARRMFREGNAAFTTLVMEGKYLDSYREELKEDMPEYDDNELKIISSPLDFFASNSYSAHYVGNIHGADKVILPEKDHPAIGMYWQYFIPESVYWILRFTQELWNPKEQYISENGCAAADSIDYHDGEIYDTTRLLYVRQSMIALHRAVTDSIPVKGYFLWSLLDNFEWCYGYGKRYGLCYVDYKTQKRTLKSSAKFYRETIRNNTLA